MEAKNRTPKVASECRNIAVERMHDFAPIYYTLGRLGLSKKCPYWSHFGNLIFSPRGSQEGQEGPQKGCPNLGSILSPKMGPKQGGGNDTFGPFLSSAACPNPLQGKFAAGRLQDLNFHRFGLQTASILKPLWATRARENKDLQLQAC